MNNSERIKEFNVPVPWGNIAVKAWGDEKDDAVLVVHGRLDNAGAFDRLIPYLPHSFYYICIDLPSHGKSSHFPPHLPIYTLNFIIAYKLLVQYFQRREYIIMGHSYGGQIGFLFAQLYPSYVKKLIMIDTVHIYPISVKEFKVTLIDRIDTAVELLGKLENGKQPAYTYAQALNKLLQGRQGTPLTTEAAVALLNRGTKQTSDGKYSFTFDQRMKNFFNPEHDFRYAIETLKQDPVYCPVLIILGLQSTSKDHMKPLLKELKTWKNIFIEYVDSNHDVHNNDPEIIAPLISEFLLLQKGKL